MPSRKIYKDFFIEKLNFGCIGDFLQKFLNEVLKGQIFSRKFVS